MLSSIHPLGERSRDNHWGMTVASFTVGATVSGAALGAVLGGVGAMTVSTWAVTTRTSTMALLIAAAGLADLAGISPPGPQRQVNENWIGAYRGWVYGGGFGIQLGLGVMTYIVTWLLFAVFLSEILMASPTYGAVVGAVFGVGRSAAPLLAGWIDRPSRLTAFHRRMARLGPIARRVTAATAALAGLIAAFGAIS